MESNVSHTEKARGTRGAQSEEDDDEGEWKTVAPLTRKTKIREKQNGNTQQESLFEEFSEHPYRVEGESIG